MGIYDGKKLLFLGTTVASVSMVRYARSEGACVIVTDNLPPHLSAAKLEADQIADVSTRDIDGLCRLAQEERVDGICCGVSEGNLLATRAVCDRLKLPCYFTREQWDICQDKERFRNLCVRYGVPAPHRYDIALQGSGDKIPMEDICFPVIVKPADGFAAVGISICRTEEELPQAVELARQASKSSRVVVEEYVTGTEITSVYTIKSGEISLSLLRDRYPSMDHDGVTAQFDASIGPSRFYERYSLTVDPAIKKMLSGIGAYAGTVFFQGIANENGIYIFECGYRMNALCDYYNLDAANGINYMHMMVNYALTGEMGEAELSRDNPNPNQFCCVFNMTAHAGTIAELQGLENCQKIPGVLYAEFLLPEGHEIVENNSMAQSVFRAYINAPDLVTLKEIIASVQKEIRVRDDDGKSLLFLPFDTNRIVDSLSEIKR